ncbi:MAG: PAS domain S-box protein [Bacteroidetes bacterium]|nr:PAS domain S-box protein [Bacteroidota bacterium]
MKKVLLIEDDRLILETTADFLETSGFEVLKAAGGDEGILLAKVQSPDMILCDILMPGISGHEVYRILQKDITTADIPFIFLSSLSDKQDIRIGMEMGADDYITKPADPKELLKAIEARLEKFDRLLKRKELRYHVLFELASETILMINPENSEIVDANQATLEMLGYSKDELTRLKAEDVLPAGEWENVLRILTKGSGINKLPLSESRLKRKDKTEIQVQINGQVVEIQAERFFLLIARDISDIRFKEKALKESEERYKELVENIGEGAGVVDLNERFTYVNPAAAEIFGLPASQLVGQKLLNFIHPSSHTEILRQTQNRLLGQKSIYEVEVLRLDGQRRWIIVTATPQFDANGKFSGTFGIFRDMTKNKMAEARIKESEERLSAIVDLTNDYIWELDPQWRYTYVSSKVYDILGYRPEDFLGKSPFAFMLPEDVENMKESLRQFVHDYKPLNFLANRTIHRDGHIVYLESSGIPLFDSNGKYAGYRGADRDITLKKSFENQLIVARDKAEESDRLKSSILANVSHELRTPLNGILGFAEILKAEMKDTEHEMMAENIHSSGRRLMGTLNSLITLSQLVAGKVTLTIRPVILKETINSVIKSLTPQAKEKNLTVTFNADAFIKVNTDEQLLKQLCRQMIDNAIKFTEKGGVTIEVSTEKVKTEGYVIISISDTGIGVDDDYHELIFQEFRQVSEGFGRKYQGSGIGLTICKKTIDLLEGKITFESKPGNGSTFYIWLPYHQDAAAVEGETLVPADASEPKTGEKKELPWVLLVEDNLVNKELTEFFLRKVCRVEYAPDGATAIEMVKIKKYHAILMDINLGYGINGVEATKEIRKIAGYKDIPVIAVTGYTMSGDKDMLIAQGCTHYLAKPFDQASILEVMKDVLSGKR